MYEKNPPPHKIRRRRYYLHAKLKESFRLNVRSKTVYVPIQLLEDQEGLTPVNRGYLKEIIGFGYNCQITF